MSIAVVATNNSHPPLVIQARKKEIYEVVKKSLNELAISLAIGGVTILFVATPVQGLLIFSAIAIQTICNTALRISEAYAKKDTQTKESHLISSGSAYLRPNIFSYLTAYNGQILMHEFGHALSAKALFQNANPTIEMTPYLGGVTVWNSGALTALGEKLGKRGSMLVVTLMGAGTSLLVSAIAIVIGIVVESRFEELSAYLICVGRGDFYAHACYAFTALFLPKFGHDFAELALYGIHPLACSIVLLAIPSMIMHAMKSKSRTVKSSPTTSS